MPQRTFENFRRDDVARGSTIELKASWSFAYIDCCEESLQESACCDGVNLVIGVQVRCFDFIIVAYLVVAFNSVHWVWLSRHANGSKVVWFVAFWAFYTIRRTISSQMLFSTEFTFSDHFSVRIFVIFGAVISFASIVYTMYYF